VAVVLPTPPLPLAMDAMRVIDVAIRVFGKTGAVSQKTPCILPYEIKEFCKSLQEILSDKSQKSLDFLQFPRAYIYIDRILF
jgi:hypothetical protein